MEVIIRDDLTLKYENGREFKIHDLFVKQPRGESKREYISFDLTWVGSVIIKQLMIDYEYVSSIKDIKTEYQWTAIESPTTLYAISTRFSMWSCLTAKMGLDEDEKTTLESYKVSSVSELYKKSIKMGLNKLTIAGTALNTFKTGVETGQLIINHQIYQVPKITFDEWRGYSNVDVPYMDMMFRTTARGGDTWGRPGHYYHQQHIDRRSMYPTTASYERMPWGIPQEDRSDETDLELIAPVGILSLKDGKIPTIGFANPKTHRDHALSGRMGALLEDILLTGDMFFFRFEWDLINRMYDFDGYEGRQVFVKTVDPIHLRTYFEACYEQKSHLKKGSDEYTSAKKLLNALYGKFLVKMLRESVQYDGKRHTVKKQIEDLSYSNILLGAHITARARCSLIEMAERIGLENIVYMDTDSLFFSRDAFNNLEDMLITCQIDNKMGSWDLEDSDVELIVVGPKTYQMQTKKGKVITKCAGLPLSVSKDIKWEGLYEGLKVDVKKRKRDNDLVLQEETKPHTITSKPQIIRSR